MGHIGSWQTLRQPDCIILPALLLHHDNVLWAEYDALHYFSFRDAQRNAPGDSIPYGMILWVIKQQPVRGHCPFKGFQKYLPIASHDGTAVCDFWVWLQLDPTRAKIKIPRRQFCERRSIGATCAGGKDDRSRLQDFQHFSTVAELGKACPPWSRLWLSQTRRECRLPLC